MQEFPIMCSQIDNTDTEVPFKVFPLSIKGIGTLPSLLSLLTDHDSPIVVPIWSILTQ